MDSEERPALREYVGYIWIGAQPGIRVRLLAEGAQDARARLIQQYGEGTSSRCGTRRTRAASDDGTDLLALHCARAAVTHPVDDRQMRRGSVRWGRADRGPVVL